MSLTDEGHYGPKQLNMLKVIWGEGYLSPGGSEEIDEIIGELDLSNKKILDIGGGAKPHCCLQKLEGVDEYWISDSKEIFIKN